VLKQTYGLSDALARLAREGKVPHPQHKKFARDIDTVVCCDRRSRPAPTIDTHA